MRNLVRFSLPIALVFLALFALLVGWAKGDRDYCDAAMFLAVFAAISFLIVCFAWWRIAGQNPPPPFDQHEAK